MTEVTQHACICSAPIRMWAGVLHWLPSPSPMSSTDVAQVLVPCVKNPCGYDANLLGNKSYILYMYLVGNEEEKKYMWL